MLVKNITAFNQGSSIKDASALHCPDRSRDLTIIKTGCMEAAIDTVASGHALV